MNETLTDQVNKMSDVFDYIAEKTNDKEALIVTEKLGLTNPHFAITKTKEEFIKLADKLIMFRKILGANK